VNDCALWRGWELFALDQRGEGGGYKKVGIKEGDM